MPSAFARRRIIPWAISLSVTLSSSGEELSMMVGKVRLTANGRDAGVEFLY